MGCLLVLKPSSDSCGHQNTLANPVSFEGIGIHSGKSASIDLEPSSPNSGIQFIKVFKGEEVQIPALVDFVTDTRLCTTLGHPSSVKISTVEHLMAALAGSHVDNVRVHVKGDELPILDGSSFAFWEGLQAIGLRRQPEIRFGIRVLKPLSVQVGQASLKIEPNPTFEAFLEVPIQGCASQSFHYKAQEHTFAEIAPARTFSYLAQVEQMKAAGFIKGGSLKNAVVLDDGRVLNPEGLRFEDECARHKMLDLIGDFALAGAPVLGKVTGCSPGHHVNNMLLKALMEDLSSWERAPMPPLELQQNKPSHPSVLFAASQSVAVFETSAYNRSVS